MFVPFEMCTVALALMIVEMVPGALVGTDVGIPEAALDGLAVVGDVVAVMDGTAVGIAESALVGRAVVGLEVGVAVGLYVLGVVVGVCVVGTVMGVDVVGLAVGRFVVGVMGRSVWLDVVIDTMVFVIVMFVVSVLFSICGHSSHLSAGFAAFFFKFVVKLPTFKKAMASATIFAVF